MEALTGTVARLIFAIPFGIFGLLHLMSGSKMAGMVPLPGGVFCRPRGPSEPPRCGGASCLWAMNAPNS